MLLLVLVLPLSMTACGGATGGRDVISLASATPNGTPTPTAPSSARSSPTLAPPAPTATVNATVGPTVRPTVRGSIPTPTPAASGGPRGSLTEASSGTTVRVRAGQSVHVSLPGGAFGGYTQPASSSPSIARRTAASGGYPTDQPAQATFLAVRPGTADLTAATDYTCLHSNPPCLPPQRQWLVHLVVTA